MVINKIKLAVSTMVYYQTVYIYLSNLKYFFFTTFAHNLVYLRLGSEDGYESWLPNIRLVGWLSIFAP